MIVIPENFQNSVILGCRTSEKDLLEAADRHHFSREEVTFLREEIDPDRDTRRILFSGYIDEMKKAGFPFTLDTEKDGSLFVGCSLSHMYSTESIGEFASRVTDKLFLLLGDSGISVVFAISTDSL